jgi:hypothetical protein
MPGIGGFSWDEIVQLVNLRTENRGESLDLNGELYLALQELCLEKRWWWRRKVVTFNIVAGEALYDLTSTLAGAAYAPDLQQIAKNGFKIFVPSTPQGGFVPGLICDGGIPYVCPEPVFDADLQDVIIAMQSTYPPNVPSRFFLVPGQQSTLQVDPIPSLNCPAALAYWAVPNYTDDSSDLVVPLLPVWMQPLLIKKLEMQIERFSQSEEGPQKYTMVAQEYSRLLEKVALYRQFADGYVEDLRIRGHQDSVQSTR